MFTDLTTEEITRFAPELLGHTDKTLVTFQNKYWFVKKLRPPEHKKPDYLGWLIGNEIANITEVYLLSPEEINQLVSLPTLTPIASTITNENTYLVRLANSYSYEELPIKTNDEAIANELVYSVWIRRRDAHGHNRVYLQDIPIFFDHQTSFLGERDIADINNFFHEPPSDPGRAGAWRMVLRDLEIKTNDGRNDPVFHAAQFVHNQETFMTNIANAVEKIQRINVDSLSEKIKSAGFTDEETQERLEFLKNNQRTLPQDIEIMKSILLKPFHFWSWILT